VHEKRPNPADGRNETELERTDRNMAELLQEVRVVQTGVQILFGFLLTIAFQPKFEKLSSFQKADYLGTLVAAATTLIMLTAPSSWHRLLFRQGDKEHLVEITNRFTVLGLASMGLTMVGVVMLLSDVAFPSWLTALVTATAVIACSVLWYAMPLARRRALRSGSPLADPDRLDPVLPDRFDPDRETVR
jgi:Family of unknown function (DUF6328)